MSTAIAAERRPLGPWGLLRKALLLSVTAVVFSVGLGVFAVAGAVTLLRARRFYSEVLACAVGRILLRVWGVELVVHRDHPVPAGQVVYIANHTSTLDLLILLALRLHNARFFLAGKYRRVPPVGFPAWLCGTFFTVPQDRPAERVKIFQGAGRVLRATGESVFLTPEGTRVLGGEIGPFNKGAFHLATSLRAPIVPLFIGIPQEINPGKGFDGRAGRVHVWFEPAIDTSAWTLEQLEQNRDRVRALYQRLNQERRAGEQVRARAG